jgi:hypothetical protein
VRKILDSVRNISPTRSLRYLNFSKVHTTKRNIALTNIEILHLYEFLCIAIGMNSYALQITTKRKHIAQKNTNKSKQQTHNHEWDQLDLHLLHFFRSL